MEIRGTVKKRIAVYVVLLVTLVAMCLLTDSSAWRGNRTLHTMMEVMATLLASVIGILALVRFYSEKNSVILFVGVGFMGTALLDGYHAVVTSDLLDYLMPSPSESLIPWSWNASRIFLSILMTISCLRWWYEQERGSESGRVNEIYVFVVVGVMTVVCFCFFAFVPLPRAYYPELFFGRPEELVAATFFLAALTGYVLQGRWQTESFEHWLLMSLIIGFLSQAMIMSRSFTLFDGMFDLAHSLKILSYCFVLVGLLASMFALFRQAERNTKSLATVNAQLQREIEIRKQGEISLQEANRDLREARNTADQDRQRTDDANAVTQAIVETATDAIITINQKGIIDSYNTAAENIFGYSTDEVLGNNVNMLMPQPDRSHHDRYLSHHVETGEKKIIGIGREVVGQRKNGETFPMDLAISEVKVKGRQLFTGIVRDITERKHTEALLQESERKATEWGNTLAASNAELEQFAYVASHDLQEPMRKIASCCQILQTDYADKLDDDGKEWVEFAVSSATRMRNLIKDLLAFSRVGRADIATEMVDANSVCLEAIDNLQSRIDEMDAEVITGTLPEIKANRTQLGQLFQNLIGNGLKYRSKSAPRIEVGCKRKDELWEFFVKDNGIGIEAQYADRIFAIFQRLHNKDEYTGTGIGLAICKKIVDQAGGKIWMESALGEGTTFYFTWPQHSGEGATNSSSKMPATSSTDIRVKT